MSIQWYLQPFASAGDYDGFKELAEPRTFRFLRYGADGPSTLEFDGEANLYNRERPSPVSRWTRL